MRCVMRVISFVGTGIAPVAPACLQQLSAMLLVVCKNPTQPGFNHYLFESVAALVRCALWAQGGGRLCSVSALVPSLSLALHPLQVWLRGQPLCRGRVRADALPALSDRAQRGCAGARAAAGGARACIARALVSHHQFASPLLLQEFHPYVFQIFAQLLELRPLGAPIPEVRCRGFWPAAPLPLACPRPRPQHPHSPHCHRHCLAPPPLPPL